jgi:hypothetical protein
MFRGLNSSSTLADLGRGLWTTVALCCLAVALAWFGLSRVRDQADQVPQRVVPAIKTVLGVMSELREGRLLELQYVTARGDEARRTLEGGIVANRHAVERHLQSYQPLDALDQQHQRDVTRAALHHWAAQDQVLAAGRHAAENTASAEAVAVADLSQGVSLQSYTALSQAVDAWRLHGDHVAEAASQAGQASLVRNGVLGWAMVLSLLAAVAIGAKTMLGLIRNVQMPLEQAVGALRSIIGGDMGYRLKIRRADEFGLLLATIDDMREVVVPLARRDDEEDDELEPLPVRATLIPARDAAWAPRKSLVSVTEDKPDTAAAAHVHASAHQSATMSPGTALAA